jgi:hypothetical protein
MEDRLGSKSSLEKIPVTVQVWGSLYFANRKGSPNAANGSGGGYDATQMRRRDDSGKVYSKQH